MTVESDANALYWETSYEIVLRLVEVYPDADLDSMGLQQLKQYIITLPNFADDPDLANDGILSEILREWYEEADAG